MGTVGLRLRTRMRHRLRKSCPTLWFARLGVAQSDRIHAERQSTAAAATSRPAVASRDSVVGAPTTADDGERRDDVETVGPVYSNEPTSSSSSSDNNSTSVVRLLSTILDHWRWCNKQRYVEVPYTALQVWERIRDHDHPRLSLRCYSILLSGLAHDAATSIQMTPDQTLQLAEDILQHYYDHRRPATEAGDDDSDENEVVLWNSLLTVYAKTARRFSDEEGAARTEAVLRRMQQPHYQLEPNEISYANVLEAYASTTNTVETAQHAEQLLQELLDRLQQQQQSSASASSSTTTGDLAHCYLPVLQAWCQCDAASDGADRAHALLQDMIQSYLVASLNNYDSNSGSSSDSNNSLSENDAVDSSDSPASTTSAVVVAKPTRHCFSAVMSGYARRGQTERVEALLADLQRLYEATGDTGFVPTVTTFNSVLEAYTRQASPAAAARAQQLLERLFQMAAESNMPTVARPDRTSVNTCIHAWATSGAPDAVERAEDLLVRASTGAWPGILPDAYSYTTVLKAWTRSDRPEAAGRCEAILRSVWELVDKYDNSDSSSQGPRPVPPNDVTYSTVIFTWSKRAPRDPTAPLRAEAVYHDMLQRYQKGDESLKPSLSVYTSLIWAWAHSSRPESDARAQLYFDQMRGKFMAGDDKLRPNAKIYNALITSKQRHKNGAGAEQVLHQMYHDFLQHKNISAMPNRIVFHNVMSAWAASNNTLAYQRIEAILRQMQKEHETRGWDCRPNGTSFSILLSSLARVGQREAAERAEEVLRHMHALASGDGGDPSVKPNNYCYATVLNAWARVSRSKEYSDAPLRAQALFDDMRARHQGGDAKLVPNTFAYSNLLSAWANSGHPDAGRNALAVLNEMEDRHALDSRQNEAPKDYHFNDVLCAFARAGDVDNAERVWDRMVNNVQQRLRRPTLSSVNTLVSAYAVSQRPDAIEKAQQLLQSAKALTGQPPNVVTYTAFLTCWQHTAAARSGRDGDDAYATVKTIVEEMAATNDPTVTPNQHTFEALLRILLLSSESMTPAERQQEANDVVALMERVGVRWTDELHALLGRVRAAPRPPPKSSGSVGDDSNGNGSSDDSDEKKNTGK